MNSDLKPHPYIKIPKGKATKEFLIDVVEYFIQCNLTTFGNDKGDGLEIFNLEQKTVLFQELWEWLTKGATPNPENHARQAAVLYWALRLYQAKFDDVKDNPKLTPKDKKSYDKTCEIFFASAREYGGLDIPGGPYTDPAHREGSYRLLAQLGYQIVAYGTFKVEKMRHVSFDEYFQAAHAINFVHLAEMTLKEVVEKRIANAVERQARREARQLRKAA